MTADGRITTARLTPGTKIHVEVQRDSKDNDYLVPTTRKRTPVAVVKSIAGGLTQHGRRAARYYTIETDLGTMTCGASTTQLLDTTASKSNPEEVAKTENNVQSSTTTDTESNTTRTPRRASTMAPKRSTKTSTKSAPPESAHLLEKEPTAKHEAFAAFVKEQTGCTDEDFNPRAAQLAYALVAKFQKSEQNQQAIVASREAREQAAAEREERAQARAAAKAEKEAAAKAEKPAATKGTKTAPAAKGATATKGTKASATGTKPVRRGSKGAKTEAAF